MVTVKTSSKVLSFPIEENQESSQEKTCRICFENETPENPTISPCECSGSMKYIHEECLKKWITSRSRNPSSFLCDVCKSPLRMEICVRFVLNCKDLRQEIFKIIMFPIIIVVLSTIVALLFLYLCTSANDSSVSISAKIYLSFVMIACFSIDAALVLLLVKAVKFGCFQIEIKTWKILNVGENDLTCVVNGQKKEDLAKSDDQHIVVNTSNFENCCEDEPVFRNRERLESGITDCQSPTIQAGNSKNEIIVQDA